MERKIEKYLIKWKTELLRKPLIIYGARQIGKTYTVLDFGKKEYKNIVYINTYHNKEIEELFLKEKSKDKVIMRLSLITSETIMEEDTLIVLDNISNIEIAKALKMFGSNNCKHHIIGITSNKNFIQNIKGEELQLKYMTEMDFEEYLIAHGEKQMAEIIRESFSKRKTCPFHKLALDYFQKYIISGGLPEVVYNEINNKSEIDLEIIKQKIISIYERETLLNDSLIDITRSLEVFSSIPEQLLKKNKKFQYSLIKQGARKTEYEKSIENLSVNQLIYRSYKINSIKKPISLGKIKESFKLYMIDDGLLYTMLNLNYKKFLTDENIKELLYENHIAKTLSESNYSLYYYQSEGKAEVNFVVQNRQGIVIPIELSIKKDSKAKSLSVFMSKFTVEQGIRVTENNFATKKDIRYIPIYSIFCFNENNY